MTLNAENSTSVISELLIWISFDAGDIKKSSDLIEMEYVHSWKSTYSMLQTKSYTKIVVYSLRPKVPPK